MSVVRTGSSVAVSFPKAVEMMKRNELPQAFDLLTEVLLEAPNFVPAWNNRGSILLKMGSPFDAVMNFDRAVELAPDVADYYNNRGAAYFDLEYFDRALADYTRALDINPNLPVTVTNRGNALMRIGMIKKACAVYREAVRLGPDYPEAHLGLSYCQLKLGNLEEGWKEFEWRWKSGQLPPRGLPYPVWEGQRAKSTDDVLLIYGEQGMGDVLQFVRLAPMAKALWGGKVALEVTQPLVRLVQSLPDINDVVALGERLPKNINCCVALMTLPSLLGIKQIEDIPDDVPYLHYDDYRAGLWKERLKALPPGMLVGICWAGMSRDQSPILKSVDARRSMQIEQFKPLAKIPGISWVSLQLGPPREQVKTPPTGMHIGDWGDDLYDFFDTAALVGGLDLVITVDTAIAHLAGALGKPVWVLSRYDACWRWLMNRDDSPWYPSMKLFTQEKAHDWDTQLERMQSKLIDFKRNWVPRKAA
jgi:tetratricopeptide (TPR) repeat protein